MWAVLVVYFTLNGQEYFRPVSVYKSEQACSSATLALDKTDVVPVGATQISAKCIEFEHADIEEDGHDPTKNKDWNW